MASKNGVQKRPQAKKVGLSKPARKSNGQPTETVVLSKRPAKDETVISSDESIFDSNSDEAVEPVKSKATKGKRVAQRRLTDDSDSGAPVEPRRKHVSAALDSSEDEELDPSLSTRRTSTKHLPAAENDQPGTIDNCPPPIPQKLLTRLLYEGFEDKNMRVGREAMNVYAKYIETFVREALARAIYEKEDADKEGGGLNDGFVQVEDLERIAPQLVLDF